jgi:predicted esterase
MGGRAALRAGGHPVVAGVIALAPWCPKDEPVGHLDGRRVVTLHGDLDRVTDPADTELFASRARRAGARVAGYRVAGSGHTLMRRAAAWHRTATRLTLGLLNLGELPTEASAALALDAPQGGGLALPLT